MHALTASAWLSYKHVAALVTGEDYACWPLLPGCDAVRGHLSPGLVTFAVFAYATLGLAGAGLFLLRRPALALATFVAASGLGAALYALDYRMRLNQTYMLSAVVLALLFAPRPKATLQVLVALFYFWAGTLKLNHEWLSGDALYARPTFLPPALVPAGCVYVVVLELGLVWGLFAQRPVVRWGVYAQLLLFHAASWGPVGYYYPLLMLGLTAVYPLVWRHAPADGVTLAALRGEGRLRGACAAVAGAFSALQMVPWLYPGDTAMTGEGRLFALHMFDARIQCQGGAVLRTTTGSRRADLINEGLEQRLRCDPIVLRDEAERLCRLTADRPEVLRVDVAIDARRSSEATFRPLIRVDDFCRSGVRYSPWRHNEWIGGG